MNQQTLPLHTAEHAAKEARLLDECPMTDAGRELYIKDCGRLMEQAMSQGNRELAMNWMQAQRKAIAERSPEQLALLVAEEKRRLDEGLDYFGKQGRTQEEQHEATLGRIEEQRERDFDVPGTMEGHNDGDQ